MGIRPTFGWFLSGLIVWSNRWLEAETRRQVEWLRSYWVPLSPSSFDTPDHPLQPVAQFLFWYWYWFSFWYWWNDSAPNEFLCPPLIRHTPSLHTAVWSSTAAHYWYWYWCRCHWNHNKYLLYWYRWNDFADIASSFVPPWLDTPDHYTLQYAAGLLIYVYYW